MKVRVEWAAREDARLDRALADPRLSFRAKGLLAHLLSIPSTLVGIESLVEASSEGKDAIHTALQELDVAGYCERLERIDEGETREEVEAPQRVEAAVMDSLFGEPFAPSIQMDERPEQRRSEAHDPLRSGVERVISHLNRLREGSWDWAQYTPLSAKYAKNTEHIGGRLRDGYREGDLILVLDYLAATDGGKEESRRYFNCVTPFNTKNFESNVAMAREWDARGRPTGARRKPGTSRGKDYYLGPREEKT